MFYSSHYNWNSMENKEVLLSNCILLISALIVSISLILFLFSYWSGNVERALLFGYIVSLGLILATVGYILKKEDQNEFLF